MKKLFIIFITCMFFNTIHAELPTQVDTSATQEIEYKKLVLSLSGDSEDNSFKHIILSVLEFGKIINITDEWSVRIDKEYRSVASKWKAGDQIYITWDLSLRKFIFEHSITKQIAIGTTEDFPTPTSIKSFSSEPLNPNHQNIITLSNGYVFRCLENDYFFYHNWKENDSVFVYANPSGKYQIVNYSTIDIVVCEFGSKPEQKKPNPVLNITNVLALEQKLNEKVVGQPEAIKAVSTSILIYSAGLKESNKPVGVFLFLGPTGVGKTELSKALAKEIYTDSSSLIRFDMSHFTHKSDVSRFIGSPPGFINNEDGGQLTNPLQSNPQRVVLLDEIEKAAPEVRKFFLPVFDDGLIRDANNNPADCTNAVFIMTSNLCGPEIAELYRHGLNQDEILSIIEPKLIEALSPELYNRVEPVLFHSIEKETMKSLVELLLNNLKNRVWEEKRFT